MGILTRFQNSTFLDSTEVEISSTKKSLDQSCKCDLDPHRSRRYRASRSLGADILFNWCKALVPLSIRISSSSRCFGTSIR